MLRAVFERVENIVEKEENAGNPAFSSISTMFFGAFFSCRVIITQDTVLHTTIILCIR